MEDRSTMQKNSSRSRWCIRSGVPEECPSKFQNRIAGAVKQYKEMFYNRPDGAGSFYVSDLFGVMECSEGDAFDVISTALMAGFMIGYRKGRVDQRKIYKNK